MGKQVSFKVGNVGNLITGKEKAEKLYEIFKTTYANFGFLLCPVGGSIDILAETSYFDTEEEAKEFYIHCITWAAIR